MNIILQKYLFSKSKFIFQMKENVLKFNQSKVMEQILPRIFKNNYANLKKDDDFETLTKSLSNPIYELIDRGGKRWRPALCFIIAELFNKPHETVYEIAALVELIHNGTLIVDDIEDDSQVRRNKPCIHIMYGEDIAVNAGNFIYFAPLLHFVNSGSLNDKTKLELTKICLDNMTTVHFGQAWDIMWHKDHNIIPNEHHYFRMAEFKTGALSKMAARLSCLILEQPEEIGIQLANFASKIGTAFQIQDDILNLVGTEKYTKTKGYLGEDIHEGKLSLIMIHSLERQKSNRLLEILKSRPTDQNIIDEAITLVQSTNSIEYAQKKSIELIKEAWDLIDPVLEESEAKNKLKMFASYLIERDQ